MARPRRYDEPAVAVVRVRVTLAQRNDLSRVARENGVRPSDVIRDAVNEYVADYRERPVFRGPNQRP